MIDPCKAETKQKSGRGVDMSSIGESKHIRFRKESLIYSMTYWPFNNYLCFDFYFSQHAPYFQPVCPLQKYCPVLTVLDLYTFYFLPRLLLRRSPGSIYYSLYYLMTSVAFQSVTIFGSAAGKVAGKVSTLVKLGVRITLPVLPGGGYAIEVLSTANSVCEGINEQIDAYETMNKASEFLKDMLNKVQRIVRNVLL